MAITVPTYQRQTAMTPSVPAASLSVRADVAGLTQATRAQTQFAEQVQQTGQFAFHTFLGQHREAELAKHDAETTRELDKVRAEAAKMEPKESLDYYERASKAAISRISSGIKDPVLQHNKIYTSSRTVFHSGSGQRIEAPYQPGSCPYWDHFRQSDATVY
jgi:hypothetical protein